ncbi:MULTISPECIES: hypothetical protein [unclassified Streptomyces]|uniref:hypothetical protein n=1 Tax=unclassified Streptomyces TaxID=2593676 RepID=UPI002E296966|nr:hypothetical protein [Streptomyces sp. NBC_00285]
MTEKMQALRALSAHGECTVLQIADATGIQSGRVFAALQALVREQCAVSAKREGDAFFSVTDAGRQMVESWELAPKQEEMGRA